MDKLNKTEQHKKAVVEALEKSLGIVSTACNEAGIGRTQFYTWLKEDKEFKEKVDNIGESSIDFVESKLFELINGVEMVKSDKKGDSIYYTRAPDTTAIIFFLKTKAKHRGYVERQELTGKDGKDFNFTFKKADE